MPLGQQQRRPGFQVMKSGLRWRGDSTKKISDILPAEDWTGLPGDGTCWGDGADPGVTWARGGTSSEGSDLKSSMTSGVASGIVGGKESGSDSES